LLGNGYTGRESLLSIIDTYGVDAVLAGHVHWDDVTYANDTLFLTTTTVSSGLSTDDAYWGYRQVTVTNNTLHSYNYQEPKYSIPLYRLNASFDHNDGTATTVTAHLENDLVTDVTAYFSFYVPSGTYVVDNANIIDVRTDGTLDKINIAVVLPAQSETSVTVHPP
jgi:hypothetical protein